MKPAKTVRGLVLQVMIALKTARYRLAGRWLPRRILQADVPYFAQWESRELVAPILRGEVQARDDPRWRQSGAKTRAEYAAWSWSGCGMACLKMILAHRDSTVVPLAILGKKCAEYDGYDLPLETSIGLKYGPFVRFVWQEFDMPARAVAVLPAAQIVHELARGNYVIASVNAAIRDTTSRPAAKGGHLVLVTGYDLAGREFYIHNPSGGSAAVEAYAPVRFKDFGKFFSGRGIVVSGQV